MKLKLRKIALAVITMVCTILLTGCGEITLYGEVTEVNIDAQTGVFSFQLLQDGGEPITVVTDQNTHIFSWLDEVSESDLRTGAMEGIFVEVTGRSSHSNMNATEVQIDRLRIPAVHTLEDGTQIDRMIGFSDSVYCLEDGTQLLMVRDTIGPDNVHSGTVESLGELPQEAQQNIKMYFAEQGILYDVFATLENAYDAYYILKDKFSAYTLSQEIGPIASSDEVIYYLTIVTTPDLAAHGHAQLRLGVAFDKDTGEVIPTSDLFTCEADELIKQLLEICKVEDEALTAEMIENFKLEYMVFFPDNLKITFPAEALPEYGISHGMGFDYSEEVRALIQPWAVPNGSGQE